MLLKRDLPNGEDNLKLQIAIFSLETNEETNKAQTEKKKERENVLFHLFSKYACVNAINFVQ